jgi:hypothetical protein
MAPQNWDQRAAVDAARASEEFPMSKNNNVNPGQYKVAGRERQGEQLQQTDDKHALAQERAAQERATATSPRKPEKPRDK